MDGSEASPPPRPAELSSVFEVTEVRRDGDRVLYVGQPLVSGKNLEQTLWSTFRESGYEFSLKQSHEFDEEGHLPRDSFVLVAEPWSFGSDGLPWTNIVLFFSTVLSTLFAGAVFWYQIPLGEEPLRIVEAWPFVAAILGVLGIHELGHYVMSRYHRVDASLPYFIPVPTIIGSLGAVIRIKGRIPNRRALFDIGVAGPLAGLVATVVVTAVGLQLDPLPVQAPAEATAEQPVVIFNHPPLLDIIAMLTGTSEQLETGVVHPVVFGGWVGMLVTLLNMIPVGQLDGGHIVRSVAGDGHRTLAVLVPVVLFGLAVYTYIEAGWQSMTIWVIWGVFAVVLARAGPATPIKDAGLGRARIALGVLTFVLAALCFTPVPIEIVEPSQLS